MPFAQESHRPGYNQHRSVQGISGFSSRGLQFVKA
jgi:hypothetical protein